MTDTALRYVEMLRLLPGHPRRITAGELHQKLEASGYAISRRSVERDLNKLSERYPIVWDENARPAGWGWRKDAGFSAPGMSVEEALEMDLAARYLRPLVPASVWQVLAPRRNEARATLALLSQAPLARWKSRVAVVDDGQPLLAPVVAPDVLEIVHRSLLNNRCLSVAYQSVDAEEARRFEIHPIALVYVGQVGYLVATLWNYADVRHLALHRMSKPEALEAKARLPEGFDLNRYLREDAAFDLPGEREMRLKLRVSGWLARHLGERKLSEEQQITPDPENTDRWIVRVAVRESERLYWWLRSHGEEVEVLQPVALRTRLAKEMARLADRYSSPATSRP